MERDRLVHNQDTTPVVIRCLSSGHSFTARPFDSMPRGAVAVAIDDAMGGRAWPSSITRCTSALYIDALRNAWPCAQRDHAGRIRHPVQLSHCGRSRIANHGIRHLDGADAIPLVQMVQRVQAAQRHVVVELSKCPRVTSITIRWPRAVELGRPKARAHPLWDPHPQIRSMPERGAK